MTYIGHGEGRPDTPSHLIDRGTRRLRQAFAGFVVALGVALLALNLPALLALGRVL